MSIKKIFAAALVCAAAVTAFGQTVDPCTQTTKLSATASGVEKYTGNSNGPKALPNSPYNYEMWTNNGGANNSLTWFGPNQGGGAAFKTEWNNSDDYLGRVGYYWGKGGLKWDNLREIYADFNYTRSANGTGGGYSYVGIYGWTWDPMMEWYIIDDWFGEGQLGTGTIGGSCQAVGSSITVDGGTYNVYTCTRSQGSGSIDDAKPAFPQIFSIRQGMANNRRQCGTYSVTEHFREWAKIEAIKNKIGKNTYDVKFLVEAGSGTGWFEASYLKLTQEDIPRGLPAGNYVLIADVEPAGSGEITRNTNAPYYPAGTSVALTVKAADGWVFDGWSGDLAGTTSPATVTMNAHKNVVANFSLKIDGSNLVKNGKFNANSNNGLGDPNTEWKLNTWGSSNASASSSNGAVTININTLPTTGNRHDLQLVQAGIPLLKGNKYQLTFEAKAASARKISVVLQMPEDPWTDFLRDTSVELTTTSQLFEYEFDMKADNFPNGRLGFDFGNATPAVTIGNVSLVLLGKTSIADRNITQANVKKSTLKVTVKKSAINVKFKAKGSGTTELRLYGLKGDLVAKANLQTASGKNYSHTFNTGKMSSGFYIVSVQSNGSVERSKVIMPK